MVKCCVDHVLGLEAKPLSQGTEVMGVVSERCARVLNSGNRSSYLLVMRLHVFQRLLSVAAKESFVLPERPSDFLSIYISVPYQQSPQCFLCPRISSCSSGR